MIRWKLDRCEPVMDMDIDGEYVEYADAMKQIIELRQEVERLKGLIVKAQSLCCNLIPNCIDCVISDICNEVGRITKKESEKDE